MRAGRIHLSSRRRGRAGVIALAITVAAAGACSVSQDQEVAIGQQNADQVNAQLPLVRDPGVTGYFERLGAHLARTTSRADLQWHFFVVNTSEANAFALPGGFVYVNRGLIELTRDEAELAGALAHEIGHVVERHAVRQMQSRQTANVGVTLVCTLTNVCTNDLGRVAIQVGGAAAFARYSRRDEAQADSDAVVITLRAGIDPEGVPALLERLLATRQARPNVVDGWFADHPLEESRIERTRVVIAELGALPPDLTDTSAAYRAMRERLAELPPAAPPRPRASPDAVPAPDGSQDPTQIP